MVDENFKEQVRARLNIVSLISEYVPLAKKGKSYFGCCPFHHEKTPSFSVNEEGGYYHCFGCGKSGDIFSFYMGVEGATFVEALKTLAAKAGLEMPDSGPLDPQEEALRKRREFAYSLLERAKNLYIANLNSQAGARACDYLKQRHFIPRTWEQFELGYGGDRNGIKETLAISSDEELSLALELGVIGKNEQGELYNPFAQRLMIPIRDAFGHVVGFGGRTLLAGNSAKYINSPQSFVFDKSHLLFAFNLAKTEAIKRQEILLVEGYMDVMACFQMGCQVAVASLGTSVTEHHAESISRLKCRVVLGLDSDASGTNAMLRSAELLLRHQINVTAVRWPAKDPGELLGTPAIFRQTVNGAKHICAYVIDLAIASLDGSVEKIVAAVDMITPLLEALPAGLQRDLYLAMTAEKLHLSREQLQKAMQDSRDKRRRESAKQNKKNDSLPKRQDVATVPLAPPKPEPPPPIELQVVKEIIARKALWWYIGELVPLFSDERLGRFLTEIANKEACPTEDIAVEILGDVSLARMLLAVPEALAGSEDGDGPDNKVLADLQYSLQEHNLKRDLCELQMAIDRAQKSGDEELLSDLLLRKRDLRISFQQIKEARRK